MTQQLYTIDAGNSSIKIARFENGMLCSLDTSDEKEGFQLDQESIFSSVRNEPIIINSKKESIDSSQLFRDGFYIDMPVKYAKTLGNDRVVAAYEVFHQLDTLEKALVIDAGTFITLDVVTSKGFEGGYIVPGIELLASVYAQGKNLHPPKNLTYKKEKLPTCTDDSMGAGASGLIASFIQELIHNHGLSTVYLAGGSGKIVKDFIPTDVKFIDEPNLVHLGLFRSWQSLDISHKM